uniref:Uncharacterized protein n=1 Tax=Arundo donax TaxID=35708 RepID=A0A0A8YTC3_ARUDO
MHTPSYASGLSQAYFAQVLLSVRVQDAVPSLRGTSSGQAW